MINLILLSAMMMFAASLALVVFSVVLVVRTRHVWTVGEEDTEKVCKHPAPPHLPDSVRPIVALLNARREPMPSKEIAFVTKQNRNTVAAVLTQWKVGNKKENPGLFVHYRESATWGLSKYGPPSWWPRED